MIIILNNKIYFIQKCRVIIIFFYLQLFLVVFTCFHLLLTSDDYLILHFRFILLQNTDPIWSLSSHVI